MKKLFGEKYGTIANYILLAVLICTLALLFLIRIDVFVKLLGNLIQVISPLIYAVIFVIMVNPVMMGIRNLFLRIFKKIKNTASKLLSVISAILAYIIVFAIISAFLILIILPITEGILKLQGNFSEFISTFTTRLSELLDGIPYLNTYKSRIVDYISNSFLFSGDFIQKAASTLASLVSNVASETVSIAIGIIISIYIISSKEHLVSLWDRIIIAFFKKEKYEMVRDDMKKAWSVYTDYTIGHIVYSALMALVLFILFAVGGMPFYSVASVLIGFSAFVPVYGTIIGVVIGLAYPLIVSSSHFLYGVICVVTVMILFRISLYRFIIREDARLGALPALVSILVFFELFGLLAALFAVPTYICLYRFLRRKLKSKLEANDTKGKN